MFLGILGFIVLLLVAIVLHEAGHFFTARRFGIKCSQFFVGFGRTLWSRRGGPTEVVEIDGELVERGETEYGVKLLLLGGFVKVLGMSPFEEVPEHEKPRSFQAAKTWQRALVLGAGSITHFISAFVVIVFVLSVLGYEDPDRATLEIAGIAAPAAGVDAPAAAAGLQAGDRIVSVNSERMDNWDEFRDLVRGKPNEALKLTYERDGETRTTTITPTAVQETDDGPLVGKVGVGPALAKTRQNPVEASWTAVKGLGSMTGQFIVATPRLLNPRSLGLTGDEPDPEERAISIVGAGRIAGELGSNGDLARYLFFFASLNVFIGLFNLLPLPPLDGGHLLLLAIERMRGRSLSENALHRVMVTGFVLLLALGVLLIFRDIFAPFDMPV